MGQARRLRQAVIPATRHDQLDRPFQIHTMADADVQRMNPCASAQHGTHDFALIYEGHPSAGDVRNLVVRAQQARFGASYGGLV